MAIGRFEGAPSFAFLALQGLLIGTWLLHSAATYDGIPIRSKLTKATGHVTWTTSTGKRSAIRFRLEDVARTLQYSRTSGELGEVLSAIQFGGFGEPLTVLYDAASPRRSFFAGEEIYEVYEMSRAKESIRGWADVDQHWRRSKRMMGWWGAGCIVLSTLFALHAIRLGRRSRGRK